jgi:hypothetical protein
LQHRYSSALLHCGDDEKEQSELLKVNSEMQLAARFMPSQTHWEDSYGNQEGKQEVCKEVLEQIEPQEHEQKESQQEGNEEDSHKKIGSEESFVEKSGEVYQVNST